MECASSVWRRTWEPPESDRATDEAVAMASIFIPIVGAVLTKVLGLSCERKAPRKVPFSEK